MFLSLFMMFLRVYLDMVCSTSKKVGISWDIRGIMIRIMGIKQDIEPTIVQFGCVWNWGIAPKGNVVINHHIWADGFFGHTQYELLSNWWFGTFGLFNWEYIILPTDFHSIIFQRGRLVNHQPVIVIFRRWDNLIDNPDEIFRGVGWSTTSQT